VSRTAARSLLALIALAILWVPAVAREEGASGPSNGTAAGIRWGGVYTGLIDLGEDEEKFPWNDPLSEVHITDRISLMLDAGFSRYFNLFIKGTTGLLGEDEGVYSSRFFIDQGHFSASSGDRLGGSLFLRERAFDNRGRLMFFVSNDSELISRGGEGLSVSARTAGPAVVRYIGAVFRDPDEQKENGGLPAMPAYGDYLNILDAGVDRLGWHLGLTLAGVRSQRTGDFVAYGIDGGFGLGGGRIMLEFARSSAGCWSDVEGGILDIDFDEMKWGSISSGLPEDGALAAEWTGFVWDTGKGGRFGLTPGYRYSGDDYMESFGEIRPGHVESYVEVWWKHAKLASLISIKAADRYDYSTGDGGGLLETSCWTRLRGGLEATARAFFAEGRRPVVLLSTTDDNSLTRLTATARIDDTGGESEFSFLTEAGVNLGRRWTIGGSIYLERSVEGYYSAHIEMRGGKRFVLRASAGTYSTISNYAALNYDPAPQVTSGDRVMSFYTRIWLGGI
jgi:hypothetical protein